MGHTADNLATELKKVAAEWSIADKITCVVTDNASNMKAAVHVHLTRRRHLPCFAHTLNLIVQDATEKDQEVCQVRHKARSIATFFKQSVKANDKLMEIQQQLGSEVKSFCEMWSLDGFPNSSCTNDLLKCIMRSILPSAVWIVVNSVCDRVQLRLWPLRWSYWSHLKRQQEKSPLINLSQFPLWFNSPGHCSQSLLNSQLHISSSRNFYQAWQEDSPNIEANYTLAVSYPVGSSIQKAWFWAYCLLFSVCQTTDNWTDISTR